MLPCCHAVMQMQESGSAQGGRPKKNELQVCFKHSLIALYFENLGTAVVHMHCCWLSEQVREGGSHEMDPWEY